MHFVARHVPGQVFGIIAATAVDATDAASCPTWFGGLWYLVDNPMAPYRPSPIPVAQKL